MMSAPIKHSCSFCLGSLDGPVIAGARGRDGSYDVYICNTCQVGITLPPLSREERASLYAAGSYRAAAGKRFHWILEGMIHNARLQRKRRIEKFKRGGKLLDIGCGRGLFLSIMKMNGWEVAGIEVDEETARQASKTYGLHVIAGDVRRSGLQGGYFDVITLIHVLEHVEDPRGMIRECYRMLANGGMLVVAVPNLSSLQASFGGKDWFHLDPPYHVHHFSEDGLVRLLERESFGIRKIKRFDLEQNPFGWLQTMYNWTGIRRNVIFDRMKREELRDGIGPDAYGKDLYIAFALFPLFLPLSVILALFESLMLRRSGTIEVFAEKR